MWRVECAEPLRALLIEATNNSFRLPDKGLVGPHAIFDAAMLDTPRIDDAFREQQGEHANGACAIKRRNALSTVTYPFNPLDAVGWHGDLSRGAHQRARPAPADEPPLSPAALGAHHVRRGPLRGLHASCRGRSRPIRAR